MEFGQYSLHSELQKLLDHVPLIIEVGIREINIDISILSIKKNSKEEKNFIKSLMQGVENLDVFSIRGREDLQNMVNQLAAIFDDAWCQHSKWRHVTKHSKEW